MTSKLSRAAALAFTILVFGATAALAPPASASSGTTTFTGHCDPSLCGLNPVLTGPPPPFVTIPANCPSFLSSDPWTLAFVSGTAVFHETMNANGDWFSFTANGQAELTTSNNIVQYAGQLTVWGGGGNNAGLQNEGGFTLTFHGTGIAGTLDIHVTEHGTVNNNGIPTASAQNISVTCS